MDADEQVVNFSSSLGGYIPVNFTVPTNAVLGATRMRVSINYGTPTGPCGMYTNGETEDYTVVISPPLSPILYERTENRNDSNRMSIFPNPSSQEIHFITDETLEGVVCIRVYSTEGKMLKEKYTEDRSLYIGNLPEGYYLVSLSKQDKVYTSKFILKK
ncbi:MAG: T9SS type A sorting domain-containing protein [Bacteroidetes bacterium]|nr:T9SS type A sorting domain-containing protein [Bacteroidota bacterium]